MRFFNYHAPETVRMFPVPDRGIRRWDEEAIVYDVLVGTDRVLRHYSFSNRWFEVNCSLSLDGRFVTESGPVLWSFNCDICTPHFVIGSDVYNMDLWLDVLVSPDGHQYRIIDDDAFEEAVRLGWLTDTERYGARAGLVDLLGIIESVGLVNFLAEVCPFETVADCGQQQGVQRHSVAEFPMLQPNVRHRLFGQTIDRPE